MNFEHVLKQPPPTAGPVLDGQALAAVSDLARSMGLAASPAQPPGAVVDGLCAQAWAAFQQQDHAQAQALTDAVLAQQQTHVMGWHLRGLLLLAQGQRVQALAALQTALQHWDAHLQASGAAEEPALAGPLCSNLGQLHAALQQPEQALAAFDRAVHLQPDNALAHLGRAEVLAAWGRFADAGRAATQVLKLAPANEQALTLLSNSLYQCKAFPEALQAMAALERLRPATPFVAGMRVMAARSVCHWQPVGLPLTQEELAAVRAMLPADAVPTNRLDMALLVHRAQCGQPVLEPFSALVLLDDLPLQRKITQQWMDHLHPPQPLAASESPKAARRPVDGPLKLAYISSDWRDHATTHLLAGVLQHHNRARVQVFVVSYGPPTDDAMTQRLKAMGHTWVDAQAWSDAQVAQWCQQEGVQIAVDLKGLTTQSRPGIFAHRAAPVQVSWLGYPGTMAAPYYDYLLADRVVVPPELAGHYSEKLVYMPHSYQPNDSQRPIDPAPQTRAQHGLPPKGLVLCCFNNAFKFTPDVWAMWMRFLQAEPEAVLWLLQTHRQATDHLRQHAQAAGVAPERLVFAPHLPQAQHLARLQLADLSLETWPCNAHTTASDALWAGVPHVTVPGQSFASRVGASLLTALGMPECILPDLAAYESQVLSLLREPAQLAQLKQQVQALRGTCALFDDARFARDLEAVLLALVAAEGQA